VSIEQNTPAPQVDMVSDENERWDIQRATAHLVQIGAVNLDGFNQWAILNPGGVCKLIEALLDRLPIPCREATVALIASELQPDYEASSEDIHGNLPGMWEQSDMTGGQTDEAASSWFGLKDDESMLGRAIDAYNAEYRGTQRAWMKAALQAALNARAGGDGEARLDYVLGKVFFDRYGACLPCGNTKIDAAMRNDSIRHIDAALASQAVGVKDGTLAAADGG